MSARRKFFGTLTGKEGNGKCKKITIRVRFDGRSTASRSHADLFVYLGRSAVAQHTGGPTMVT